MMSDGLSERVSFSDLSDDIITIKFDLNDRVESIVCKFISIETASDEIVIKCTADTTDRPFKYFGFTAQNVIINNGTEILAFSGNFKISKIEKRNNYIISVGATSYERIIRNELD